MSSTTQKTKVIEINKNYLNPNSNNSTRKNRVEKRVKPPPLITPNNLKNKLLERIKAHKRQENTSLPKSTSPVENYHNELSESIMYLSSLPKKKEIPRTQNNSSCNNKTVKNYYSEKNNISFPHVELELPEELKSPHIEPSSENIQLRPKNFSLHTDPPYGCLKNGTKPTYKMWNTTQKNYIVTNPQEALIIDKTTQINEREKRLNTLKEKMRKKQEELKEQTTSEIMTRPLINRPALISEERDREREREKMLFKPSAESIITSIQFTEPIRIEEPIQEKQYIKKTIKRKYTLGKSKIHNRVGILIKDKDTRKRVLNSQKELKKKPINDVKKYLRDHGLIKTGSNAPNDVVRKIYESSMLSGEIMNNNKDILLHNWDAKPDE